MNSNYLKSLLFFFEQQQFVEKELKIRFDKINQINANNAFIHKEFARLFNEIGATDEAIALLKKALMLKRLANTLTN